MLQSKKELRKGRLGTFQLSASMDQSMVSFLFIKKYSKRTFKMFKVKFMQEQTLLSPEINT